jgi:hypothetical protein
MKSWAVRSWPAWLVCALFALTMLGAAYATVHPGKLQYAANNKVIVIGPAGSVWVYWGIKPCMDTILRIYPMGRSSLIITQTPEGTAMTQVVEHSPTPFWVPLFDCNGEVYGSGFGGRGGSGIAVLASLWWTSAALALAAAWLLRRAWKRRFIHGCSMCGYSREGLAPEVACPECGHTPGIRSAAPFQAPPAPPAS